jgi:hypothetical protein
MSQITIQEVTQEHIKKGKQGYTKATVVYTNEKGENRTKSLMSFANPAVFDAVKDAVQGDKYDVKAVKEGEYWNWAAAVKLSAEAAAGAAKAVGGGKVTGSNYETPDERKIKQLYIIKQSSIANAIEYCKSLNNEEPMAVDYVLDIAQKFVDFVYGNENLGEMDTEN